MEEDWEEDGDQGCDNDGGEIGAKSSSQPAIGIVPRHDVRNEK